MDRFEKFSLAVFNITHYWNKVATEEMKKYDLKAPCAIYLLTLKQYEEGVTAAKLCEVCGKDKADVSRTIKVMEERGLVERGGDISYRARVKLTEEGIKLAETINERASLAVDLVGGDLPEENRKILTETLDIILKNITKLSKDGLPD